MAKKVVVTGAGGFIGGHLAKKLKLKGYYVVGVDIKSNPYLDLKDICHEFRHLDLRFSSDCVMAVKNMDMVFNLAADMGGIGYIGTVLASLSRNNVLINTNMLQASAEAYVKKFFFSSSACVYPSYKQSKSDVIALKEKDAIPADPEAGYGWEKLFTEQMCSYYKHDLGLETRVARFHNVYGPYGTYIGGREKAPAALCRKVSEAKNGDTITVWGDGKQTRTFTYIDDCVEGILRLVDSDVSSPINIGSDELVTIDKLVSLICDIAQKKLKIQYLAEKPVGVRGRSSDNTLIKEKLNWAPSQTLYSGLITTYKWIDKMVHR